MLAQLTRRLAAGTMMSARQMRVLPLALPGPARLMAVRTYAAPPGPKGKKAAPPPPEPEVEDDNEEFEEGMDPLADLNAAAQRRVKALKEVQVKYDESHKDYLKELALLQAKYTEKHAPLFDERREIVLGKKAVEKFDVEDDGKPDEGVLEFWLGALANSKAGPYITERDAEVLKHLNDVRAEVLTGEERGFKLTFHFAENPHFTNKTLDKTYTLEAEDEVVPRAFTGCAVSWQPDMDVTVEYVKKRVKPAKGEKAAAKGTFVTEKMPTDSFFNIFDPPKVPGQEDAEKMTMEELEEVQDALSADFEIGFAIKERVIPRAVEWFTGEISPMDDDEYNDDYDDEYGEGEEY